MDPKLWVEILGGKAAQGYMHTYVRYLMHERESKTKDLVVLFKRKRKDKHFFPYSKEAFEGCVVVVKMR